MSKIRDNIKNLIDVKKAESQCRGSYLQINELLKEYSEIYPEVVKINTKGHVHYKTQEIEEKILKLIDENDSVLIIQDYGKANIGMRACALGLKNVVFRSLENEKASIQKDIHGWDIGQYGIFYHMEDVVIKALDNPIISTQQDKDGYNLGMRCAILGMENAVIKALDNPVASTQVTLDKNNIGMFAAFFKMGKATLKALENEDSVKQVNVFNKSMIDYAYEKNLTEAIEKWESMQVKDTECDVAEINE